MDDEPLSEAHIVVLTVVVDVEVRDDVRTDVVDVDAEVLVVEVFEVVTDADEIVVVVTEDVLLEVVSVGSGPVAVVAAVVFAEEVVRETEVTVVLFVFESVCVFAVEDDTVVPDKVPGKAVCTVV